MPYSTKQNEQQNQQNQNQNKVQNQAQTAGGANASRRRHIPHGAKPKKKPATAPVTPTVDQAAPVVSMSVEHIGGAELSPQRQSSHRQRGGKRRESGTTALRVISLGGLGEIGKNLTVLEYGENIMIIDCGVAFPDGDMLGIDLVIPDISYLVKNIDRVKGIVITHGHEDHIGALPYVLDQLPVPVYCTRLTEGILKHKLAEANLTNRPDLRIVKAGDVVNLGVFRVEFIHVNHSIPDACALAIRTPVGMVFHTGDFKLDTSPIDGKMMDITRIGEIGNAGVLLMMGESTNAERPGYTPSERSVGTSFETIFSNNRDKRVIIATFSSNVHRVQQIIDAAVRHKRRVAILGRSMVNVIGAANELGYMHVPEGTLIDISEIKRFRPSELCLITTGSQGEPMSALYRMAFGEHDRVKLTGQDIVVLSSHPIPGNEKLVGKIINTLIKNGIGVVNTGTVEVHVSGHACQEELKLMLALVRPKFFMPVHGESRHLAAHRELALQMGIPAKNILISDIGRVLEVDRNEAHFNGTVPSGQVFVDGSGVGDVGSAVLRERRLLAEDGMIAVVVAINSHDGLVLSRPELTTRGFVYMKDADGMMDGARELTARLVEKALGRRKVDLSTLRNTLREELQKYFYKQTKRKPVIIPFVLDT
jgi:ribonuclease J